uniref:Candidate secreted effector n=1 Tax=Meloidogyne incognita TaxID=6306 RepID=A0A914LV83_MELIC
MPRLKLRTSKTTQAKTAQNYRGVRPTLSRATLSRPPCRRPPCRKLSFAFYFKAGLNFARHVPYFIPRLQRLEIRELISVSSDWRFSCSHF